MIELIVSACPWIGKPEKVVLVTAYRRLEPSRFKYRLRQHDFRILDVVAPYLRLEVRDSQRG